ncbi:MAG: hypothetical protein CMJ31_04715 [Phycisphaerae bacterium]|nr:hypothetical protein [Phycisphaerae bacterium]
MIRPIILILGVLSTTAAAQLQTTLAPSALLDRAEKAVAEANALAASDEAESDAALREAAAAYRTLIDDHGVDSAAVHRNLGVVELRRGQLGRAIASLRRAERIAPSDRAVQDSLASARAEVGSFVNETWEDEGLRSLLFWRAAIGPAGMLTFGLLGWAAGWTLLAVRAQIRTRILGAAAFLAFAIATLSAASLTLERWSLASRRPCVVVADEVIGRRGPSADVFEPVFEKPLTEGLEAVVLEIRDGWARLRLASGDECWTPRSAIEIV